MGLKTERKNDTVASKVVDAMKGLRDSMKLLKWMESKEGSTHRSETTGISAERFKNLNVLKDRSESSDLSATEQEEE